MSFNQNFYINFHKDCSTFRNTLQNFLVPPPPVPPPYITPPLSYKHEQNDEEFVKSIGYNVVKKEKNCDGLEKPFSIREFKQLIQYALRKLDVLKQQELLLSQKIATLSEIEWNATMQKIVTNKNIVCSLLSQISGTNFKKLKNIMSKRASKRLRQKRLRELQKDDKKMMTIHMQERSRRIDEHVKKIKEDLNKAKQQEEAKQQADFVLKEVLRKKHDSKRWIVKLEALLRLKKARLNTNKGRGIAVLEREAKLFNKTIENLKSLWTYKSVQYEKEEAELCVKLKRNHDMAHSNEQFKNNLLEWRKFLFGGMELPQVNFSGDKQKFISNRSLWDLYISDEGTPLPMGWVIPRLPPAV